MLLLDVGITNASGRHLFQKRSIPRIPHGDGHGNVLRDERCSGHGNPMKLDSKRGEYLDDVLGDQIQLCRVVRCGRWCPGCDGVVSSLVPLKAVEGSSVGEGSGGSPATARRRSTGGDRSLGDQLGLY